ncbi:MAG: hypothetical protein GOMPHAMPRED_001696 [Gomphillus americanus]|uniref:Uncharacterized protein n=1 Tax=Gomphillus americanus TaxID=1940652 RepID=A0A8H3F8V9_9LECA|nr:MAG: hypothetical protein GOMPHAMPRED_001696 [Gomphillus americanus]
MVLVALAIIGGGIYVAAKHRKNRKLGRLQRSGMANPPVSMPAGYAQDVPPAYAEKHQSWCNGTCDGHCIAGVQFTPAESPVERPGREDYFGGVENHDLGREVVVDEKMGGKF